MDKNVTRFRKKAGVLAQIVGVGMLTGLIVGVIITCFVKLCSLTENFSAETFYGFFRENPAFIPLLFVALFLGSVLIGAVMRFLPSVKGSGVPQTEGAARGLFRFKWYEAITGMLAASLFTIFMGLTAGSEGPSIMIGGACGALTNDVLKRNAVIRRYQVTGGACAGISVAFNAPLTGMAFAFEEAQKRFTPEVFVCSFSSVVVAITVRNLLGPLIGLGTGAFLHSFSFAGVDAFNLMFLVYVIFAAVIVALAGVAFYYLTFFVKKLFGKSKLSRVCKGLFRVSIPFVLAGAFGLISAYVMGGGHHFIEAVGNLETLERIFSSPVWVTLLIIVVLRYIATVINIGAGVPAGAFVPILAIGAGLGALLSFVCKAMGMDPAYTDALIVICMSAFFTTIVKAPITGIVMVVELTWNYTFLLPTILGVAIGYLTGMLLHTEPIYDELWDQFYEELQKEHPQEQFTLKARITESGNAAGRELRDVLWPNGALIVKIVRGDEEISPGGDTDLQEGDILIVEGKTADKAEFMDSLEKTAGELIFEEQPTEEPKDEPPEEKTDSMV